MTKYGLIAMSAKPFHVGHMAAIEKAASECDEVRVYVSLSDRKRPGELPIFGSDMKNIWQAELEKIMPNNVFVEYPRVPLSALWSFAETVEKSGDDDVLLVFYADADDLANNFSPEKIAKYLPRLSSLDLVSREPTQRLLSGTKMREYLADGNKEEFFRGLPNGIDKQFVWSTLSASVHDAHGEKKTTKRTKRNEAIVNQPSYLRKIIMG